MINWPFPILGTYGFAINVEKRIVARGISRFARKFKGEKNCGPKMACVMCWVFRHIKDHSSNKIASWRINAASKLSGNVTTLSKKVASEASNIFYGTFSMFEFLKNDTKNSIFTYCAIVNFRWRKWLVTSQEFKACHWWTSNCCHPPQSILLKLFNVTASPTSVELSR